MRWRLLTFQNSISWWLTLLCIQIYSSLKVHNANFFRLLIRETFTSSHWLNDSLHKARLALGQFPKTKVKNSLISRWLRFLTSMHENLLWSRQILSKCMTNFLNLAWEAILLLWKTCKSPLTRQGSRKFGKNPRKITSPTSTKTSSRA